MLKVMCALMLMLAVISANAKPVSPGNYTSMEPEFRGKDAEKARKKLIKAVQRAKAGESSRAQVIVLPFKVDSTPVVKRSGGASSGQNALKKQLIQGGAQVVDRSLPSKVSKELDYIESTGSSRGVSFELADYLFEGEVLDASSSVSYSDAKSYTDKDGKTHRIPANCELSGRASVTVHFYTMNPLALEQSMVLNGKASSSIKNISASQCSSKKPESLQISAVKNALSSNAKGLQDLFSPVGYVVDRRYHNKKGKPKKGKHMIFKTTLAKKISTEKNTRVLVFKMVERSDPLTGDTTTEKAKIGSGQVVEAVGDNAIWIKLDKDSEAKTVLLGDIVEVKNNQKCSTFDVKCHKNTLLKKN